MAWQKKLERPFFKKSNPKKENQMFISKAYRTLLASHLFLLILSLPLYLTFYRHEIPAGVLEFTNHIHISSTSLFITVLYLLIPFLVYPLLIVGNILLFTRVRVSLHIFIIAKSIEFLSLLVMKWMALTGLHILYGEILTPLATGIVGINILHRYMGIQPSMMQKERQRHR